MIRQMDISVSRLLLGHYDEHQIKVWCSLSCGGATVGTKVTAYCRLTDRRPAACLMSMTVTEHNVRRVETWIADAGFLPEEATLEKMGKRLADANDFEVRACVGILAFTH